ncbi:MAG: nucleotidyltransferase domain-containing protein [Moorella sp. (in: Bacteria)]|nr:nucleotidyltransferase domain-containing protein [Moorella sp. (in: firmicutes)]
MNAGISDRMKKYFSDRPDVRMAFLFGSRAKERALPGSDVDVGVYFEPGYTHKDVLRMWNERFLWFQENVLLTFSQTVYGVTMSQSDNTKIRGAIDNVLLA